jgi:hypothetical protein
MTDAENPAPGLTRGLSGVEARSRVKPGTGSPVQR